MKVWTILICFFNLVFSLSRGHMDCYDTISASTSKAAAIFTGKVDLIMFSRSGEAIAEVIVKRVLKKSTKLKFIISGDSVKVRVAKGKGLIYDEFKKVMESKVDVEVNDYLVNCLYGGMNGYFGNGFLKKLRVNDTKIFMVGERIEDSLDLDAPPLSLKLELLDRISRAIKGKLANC